MKEHLGPQDASRSEKQRKEKENPADILEEVDFSVFHDTIFSKKGEIVYSSEDHEVILAGKKHVPLSPTQSKFLEAFIESPDTIIPAIDLYNLYNPHADEQDKIPSRVKDHVRKLRQKVGDTERELIRAHKSYGYSLHDPEQKIPKKISRRTLKKITEVSEIPIGRIVTRSTNDGIVEFFPNRNEILLPHAAARKKLTHCSTVFLDELMKTPGKRLGFEALQKVWNVEESNDPKQVIRKGVLTLRKELGEYNDLIR